jgi:hypothetical protein
MGKGLIRKYNDDSCSVCKFLCFYIPVFKVDFDCIKCGRHYQIPKMPIELSNQLTPPDSPEDQLEADKTINFNDFIQQPEVNPVMENMVEKVKMKPANFDIQTHCGICYEEIEEMDFRGLVECDKCEIWICEQCPGYPKTQPSENHDFICPKCTDQNHTKPKKIRSKKLPKKHIQMCPNNWCTYNIG